MADLFHRLFYVTAPLKGAPEFMRLLTDNGKLFLRASGYQGKQADGLFNLADVSVARDKVAETCHWSTPKSAKVKGK